MDTRFFSANVIEYQSPEMKKVKDKAIETGKESLNYYYCHKLNKKYDDNYTCIIRKFVINSVLVIYEISLFPRYMGTRDQKEVRTHEQI